MVDLSEEMLHKAKIRFKELPNFEYLIDDLSLLELPKENFDIVISSLAIHHLADTDKNKLFQKIHNWLKIGGLFINADQVLGSNIIEEKVYTNTWRKHVEANLNLTEKEKEAAFERIKLDKMATLQQQIDWLSEAGFQAVGNYYQYYNFVVFAAQK